MCGIVAWLSCNRESAAANPSKTIELLLEGLQRLEYRGYDSAGVALMEETGGNKSAIRITKRVGKVVNLKAACQAEFKPKDSLVVGGIAHTRWATHGAPSDANAHPQSSMDGSLAVVHNGIVENYAVLREHLQERGYVFRSQTDTEVLANLIHYVQTLEPELALEDVVILSLSQIKGAYGICVVDSKEPFKLIGARRGSPLLLGIGSDGIALASDAAAVVGQASRVVYLEDNDLVVCSLDPTSKAKAEECYEIRQITPPAPSSPQVSDEASKRQRRTLDNRIASVKTGGSNFQPYSSKVERDLHQLEMSLEKIEKGGHKHFMIKEILEQPRVMRDCMRGRIVKAGELRETHLGGLRDCLDRIVAARRIIITACGTSWHSAMVAEYMIESLAKVTVEVEYASEFRYRQPIIRDDDVVIAISQSGETADTLEAIRIAHAGGALCLGFVNCIGSSIARLTHAGTFLHVGPEIGVASTKAFSGQVMALALFATHLGKANGSLTAERVDELLAALETVPEKMEAVLSEAMLDKVRTVAQSYRYCQNFLFLGRGPNMPVALEGALKLKEISYIHAEGYPAAELKHGPIALIDRFMPVVVVAPRCDAIYEKVKSNIEEVAARSGVVIAITDEGNDELDSICEVVIRIPKVDEFVSPLITVVPLQLLAYYIADLRGCPIDQPRNLAKSVTVE